MIENIVRYIETGDGPFQAALMGSRQIGFTIVSLTISLIAVFIPLLLMGGVVGRLFREFAITLSVSIVISGIVSLVLTPMMCAHLLKRETRRHGRLFGSASAAFDAMRGVYKGGLNWSLRHQALTLIFTATTLSRSVWLYIIIPKGFVPDTRHRPPRRDDGCCARHFVRKHVGPAEGIADIVPRPRCAIVISLVGVSTKMHRSTADGYTSTLEPLTADRLRRPKSWPAKERGCDVRDIHLHLQSVRTSKSKPDHPHTIPVCSTRPERERTP